MRRFFRLLWILYNHWEWENNTPWSDEDSLRLYQILKGDFGVRFTAKLRNQSILINASAVQEGGNEWKSGQAAGYMLCIAHIQSLSASEEPGSSQSTDSNQGAFDDVVSHLAP